MQTPKPRPGSLSVPPKQSLSTPKTARKIKTPGSDTDSSPYSNSKTPKERISKVADRKSPRVLAVEKKRSSKVSELESQIVQLQEELKKAKHQLSTNESWRIAQQEADEAKKLLSVVTAELEETKKELKELSECEDDRILELRKISQDRDRAWQSELEAIQKQHELDTTALASAINEMRNLKIQLDRAYQSGASQARYAESAHAEIHGLRVELTETLLLVEKLKSQLNEIRESEARAVEEVTRAQMQLESLKAAERTLPQEHSRVVEAYNSLLLELEQSKNKINSLEQLVDNLRTDQTRTSDYHLAEGKGRGNGECNECDILRTELSNMKNEVSRLRSTLEAAERRFQDRPPIQGIMNKAAEMEAKLQERTSELDKVRTKLIEKEQALQAMSINHKALNQDLKTRLLNSEMNLQSITEENRMLKSEITIREEERAKAKEEALALAEAARAAADNESSIKLDSLTEEANQSFRKATFATEQLDAAQAANSDMEAELRKLKVQCDQWRKAAEAAMAMISTGDHGKYGEKTGAGFFDYIATSNKFSLDDSDDESPKKKNGNMLKRIGVLLKKGQK